MKFVEFFWLGVLFLICNAKKETGSSSMIMNLRVKAHTPNSLLVTWDAPKEGSGLVGYSLVFVPVLAHQKRRTHVELFMNRHILINLHPGTRYKIKLAPLMNSGKTKGVYTNWINARTLADNKTALDQKPDSTVEPTISSREVPGHCSRINRLCENMGYNLTQTPNHFNQQNQNDAEQELSQFTSMIQSNCSSVLHVLLCSLYFPPCTDDCDTPTPPCRSVCRAAKRDCEPWLKRYGYTWPYKFKCSAFPDPSESACVGEDGTITAVPEPVVVPEHCEPLNNSSVCHGLGYSLVQMPNFFYPNSQKDAEDRMRVFTPLVNKDCSANLQFFLCVLYFPPCVINMPRNEIIPPCREVCEEVRRGCEPDMITAGYPWPPFMDCKRFPLYDKKGFCLKPKAKCQKRTEVMKPQQRCQPLKIAMCKSLNYTHTILPNFLNHTSQAAVSRILNTKEFKSQLKSNCSTQLKRFVCFLFAPFCTSDGTPLPPCQRFCEKVKTDCANLTARWLADLDCARFPTLSRKRLCLGDPLTTIDCVGPHSRPCTVISSTFPIILRCSSPGTRFVINEITINHHNGTTELMTSTSDAARQCNQSRRQVEGRHECHFTVNYGQNGTLSVTYVAVKYHCFKN